MVLSQEMVWVIGVGLTVLGLMTACIWRVVDGGASKLQQMLSDHVSSESADISAVREAAEDMARSFADLTNRVARLEARQEGLPSMSAVHQVSLAVTQLTGRVEAIDGVMRARIEAVETLTRRVELIVHRQEQYMLGRVS